MSVTNKDRIIDLETEIADLKARYDLLESLVHSYDPLTIHRFLKRVNSTMVAIEDYPEFKALSTELQTDIKKYIYIFYTTVNEALTPDDES